MQGRIKLELRAAARMTKLALSAIAVLLLSSLLAVSSALSEDFDLFLFVQQVGFFFLHGIAHALISCNLLASHS